MQEENGNGQAARVRLAERQAAPGIGVAELTAQKHSTQRAAHHRYCQASNTGYSQGEDEDQSGCGRAQHLARQGAKTRGLKQKPPEQPVIASGEHWLIRRRTCGHIWLTAGYVKSFVPSE